MGLTLRTPAAGGRFLVIGESLVDLVGEATSAQFTACPGGSPLNVAVGLARLGQPVTFVTEYGDDPFGRVIHAHLVANAVAAVARRRRPTSLGVAVRQANRSATYDFRFGWSLARRDISLDGGTACLHIGSLAGVVAPGRRAVATAARAARRAKIPICFDPNIRPEVTANRREVRAVVNELIELADIVKTSTEDIAWLYPDENPLRRLRLWAGDGRRLVVLTAGPDGCVAIHGPNTVTVPALSIQVVDTIGAGDSFTAALLVALAQNDALHTPPRTSANLLTEILAYATKAAAITCTRTGADPPFARDLAQELTQQHLFDV